MGFSAAASSIETLVDIHADGSAAERAVLLTFRPWRDEYLELSPRPLA